MFFNGRGIAVPLWSESDGRVFHRRSSAVALARSEAMRSTKVMRLITRTTTAYSDLISVWVSVVGSCVPAFLRALTRVHRRSSAVAPARIEPTEKQEDSV